MSTALPLVAYPDLESQVRALEEEGYVYLPGVLDDREVTALRTATKSSMSHMINRHWNTHNATKKPMINP